MNGERETGLFRRWLAVCVAVGVAVVLAGAIGFGGYYLGHQTTSTPKEIGAEAPSSPRSAGGPSQQAAKRIALVIGNAAYADKPLSHPPRDAEDMARLLRELGFEVISAPEVKTLKAMREQVRQFLEAGRTAEVRLFYFSGHGANDGADSYLLPLDHDIKLPHELPDQGYPLRSLLRGLKDLDRGGTTGVNVVLVDACRDAPFGEENKSIGDEYKGLGRVDPVAGTLVAYAAGAGERAIGQASERNSLFTKHLLQRLKEPVPLLEALTAVTGAVQRENDRQLPEIRSQLTRPFYLAQPATVPPESSPVAPVSPPATAAPTSTFDPHAAELSYWESIKTSRDPADYRDFLERFPAGTFASLAQRKLREVQMIRDTLKDGSDGPEMVYVKAGCFQMGSPEGEAGRSRNERQHRICIERDYAIGRYEVTFAEYDRFCAAAGKRKPDYYWFYGKGGRGQRPVVDVGWDDATAYARWLAEQTGKGYRLPTEAEWEYAARAGTTTAFWWGTQASHEYANYGKDQCCSGLAQGRDQWEYMAPVGSFPANPWGLYDTAGNVWEWTCSEWDEGYGGGETRCSTNDTGDTSRALRGGSWGDRPDGVRSASRSSTFWYFGDKHHGFRLARSL